MQFMHDLPPDTVVKKVTPKTADIVTRVTQRPLKKGAVKIDRI